MHLMEWQLVNGSNTTTYAIQSNDNPDLKWEVKHTFDVGVDFSAFQSRLNVTFGLVHIKDKGSSLYLYCSCSTIYLQHFVG